MQHRFGTKYISDIQVASCWIVTVIFCVVPEDNISFPVKIYVSSLAVNKVLEP